MSLPVYKDTPLSEIDQVSHPSNLAEFRYIPDFKLVSPPMQLVHSITECTISNN
jgi:hypothetical protein